MHPDMPAACPHNVVNHRKAEPGSLGLRGRFGLRPLERLEYAFERFGFYETVCGGAGAGPGFDGASAVHTHMTNTRITDPELLEHRYPVRLDRFAIRHGSGGDGRWRGGDGAVREIVFLEPSTVTFAG